MGWSFTKESVESAADLVGAVPLRLGVESSEFVRVAARGKSLALSMSSDISATAFADCGEELRLAKPVYLDRRMLLSFVAAGKDVEAGYDISMSRGELVIRHGTRTGRYASNAKARGYPEMPDASKSKAFPVTETWAELVKCARMCATDDPTIPFLNCAYCVPTEKGLTAMSSDTILIFSGSLSAAEVPQEPVAFPLALADAMGAANNGVLRWTEKYALLTFPNGCLWQAVKSEARKSFPRELIESTVAEAKKTAPLFSVGAASLALAASRIASCVSSISKAALVLSLKASAGKKTIIVGAQAAGSRFREALEIAQPCSEDALVEWPLGSVLPILDFAKKAGEAKIYGSAKWTAFSAAGLFLVVGKKKTK